ncbi:hypothetical protein EJC49_04435 [Aquibium carbonis]|uniref:Uncharacterized protein n=1 Tax=Aquibium carbonis TaxID=2495581 RepID=A0A429Z1H7_9HYPH|nr:hypothetical protein [Aquibium carbonis]RST87602.1 hypothetical protein EJC49_04435 [Aquibium carbonis]
MSALAAEPALEFAGSDFEIAGKALPGHPFIRDRRRRVHLLSAAYFFELQAKQGLSPGSMRDVAYVIIDWFRFLDRRGCRWDAPKDELLFDWKTGMENSVKMVRTVRGGMEEVRQETAFSRRRIMRRVWVVWNYYFLLQNRLELVCDLMEDPDKGKTGPGYPLMVRVVPVMNAHGRVVDARIIPPVGYGTVPKRKRKKRPTPDDEQIEEVMQKVQEGATGTKGAYASACHYLAASFMARCGLRRQGVALVTILDLEKALLDLGVNHATIFGSEADPATRSMASRKRIDILAIVDDPVSQAAVRSALEGAKQKKHRKYGFFEVTEKSGPPNLARIPIDFIWECLLFIWDARAQFAADFVARKAGRATSNHLLLSMKTGQGFSEKSIGNLVKTAFNDAGVEGSGHRLRARFAERVSEDGYAKERARNGPLGDFRAVELEVKEALRQERVESQAPYIHAAVRRGSLFRGEPVLLEDSEDAGKMRGLAQALNEGDSEVRAALDLILRRFKIFPVPERDGFLKPLPRNIGTNSDR